MWKERRKRILIRNIILTVLCVAMVAVLFIALRIVRDQSEQESIVLSQAYEAQRAEQVNDKLTLSSDVEAEYQKDLDTISTYMPGIVCWGDTLTAGSSGTVSYPYILQKYIDTYICDIYDFMSTIDDADEYPLIDWDQYKVEIPVINMGVANEDTYTVLGRSGVLPYVLDEDVAVPAGTEPVEIKIVSQNGEAVSPLNGGNGGVNNVTINGIEGILTLDTDASVIWDIKERYYFTRLTEGRECLAVKDTPVVTAATDLYRDYIHVICIGTYGDYDTPSKLADQIKLLLSRQTSNEDRYLVLGICYQEGWRDMSSLDTVMVQSFGDHYINIRKYLCSDGMADAGISPTSEDQQYAQNGTVPKSLRSSAGDAGLSAKAYKLIGKVVYERMEQLGYFDEIEDELHIVEARKKALKDNPNYFTTIIKNWQ